MSDYQKKKKTSSAGRLVLILLVVVLIAGCALGTAVVGETKGWFRQPASVEVEIPEGASTTVVASQLKKAGIIGNVNVFKAYSRYVAHADGTYHYGSFTLDRGSDYDAIIKALQQMTQYRRSVTVTFPEGTNAYQMGQVLEQAGLCTTDDFIQALNTQSFDVGFWDEVGKDPLKVVRLEGYLFPDTYDFFEDEDVSSIITRILKNFEKKVLTPERQAKLKENGYTLDQLVSLAAIVQKESFSTEEMSKVASVFTNRLQPGSEHPRLESDTTNNYINDYIKPRMQGAPTEEQLAFYDSYGISGIPAGCIANPGLEAIDATLSPAETSYYFFVTDIEYNYYYGRNFQEHLDNIAKAKAVNLKYGKVGL